MDSSTRFNCFNVLIGVVKQNLDKFSVEFAEDMKIPNYEEREQLILQELYNKRGMSK